MTFIFSTLVYGYFSAAMIIFLIKPYAVKVFNAFLLVFLLTLGCTQNKSKPITEYSQNDIDAGILIDVRTPEEFQAGHMANAININWFADDAVDRFKAIEKDTPVYLYCKKGGRSAKAARLLDSLGFKKVIDLEGGYDAFLATQGN